MTRLGIHRTVLCGFVIALLALAVYSGPAAAAFVTYIGGVAQEAAWQAAVGSFHLEDFESYAVGTQFPSLPGLGVEFAQLAGGGFPVIYNHSENDTPYGTHQLGNFPNGINAINQYNDMVMLTQSGKTMTAVGFYNGDGQEDTMVATAYDAYNNVLGSAGAFKGTFAGIISSTPIAKVVFGGHTGDGWNHIDGLQTNATSSPAVPEASSLLMLGAGLVFAMGAKRKYCV
jgi:PEP-CTERM motif-containing protein